MSELLVQSVHFYERPCGSSFGSVPLTAPLWVVTVPFSARHERVRFPRLAEWSVQFHSILCDPTVLTTSLVAPLNVITGAASL
ncbi:hypothetical protein [Brevibacillus invocatus]|uniref:hypothetical protein n=1 Tax=Brevibacillus invocatus TaxID=173959 RepID=UPI00203BEB1F|nr:hypothetical protein [Brevibacillus invocatus]MCM3081922.1 hypothetical protein [Brevibacillus invocatus]MCM3432328.1 hypothetical protein [Brevibacillus invocatus]